jgi:pSer/pThr/pTyr-binding forkhead associated (FHA) protein
MNLDLILFALRLMSSLVLMLIMGAFFIVIWREYALFNQQMQQQKRVYGQLHVLRRIDDVVHETGQVYALQTLNTIGRSPTNTIVLENNYASNEYATISLRDGQWWLEDRNSRNGTHLNDERIQMATIVTDGDIIGIGDDLFKLFLVQNT